ncbi:MAG: hypothetical protein ABIH21_04190 [Patescibacteria group bacterium]
MKLFVYFSGKSDGPVSMALHQVMKALVECESADSADQAHVVISDDLETLVRAVQGKRVAIQYKLPSQKEFAHPILDEHRGDGRFYCVDLLDGMPQLIGILSDLNQRLGDSEPSESGWIKREWDEDSDLPKLLVVDDNPVHRRSATEQFKATHNLMALDRYNDVRKVIEKHSSEISLFLCDLLMPAESQTLGPEGQNFIGQEVAIGFALALFAISHDVQHVVVLTDTNHHNHPMSAVVDWVGGCKYNSKTRLDIRHAHLREDGSKDWKQAVDSYRW